MNYRIGLQIGITSVGWAVLENDSKDKPKRIVDLGVRMFDASQVPKTRETLAAKRRAVRISRRKLRRRKHRLERVRYLLQKEGFIDIEKFNDRYQKENLPNVYELRCRGLDNKLSDEEFAQILIHLAKHRGCNLKEQSEHKDIENGKVLTAISENQQIMKLKGYRTIGEMICKDNKFRTYCPWDETRYELTPRNKQEDYGHTIPRDMLVEEVHILFAKQRELGNDHAYKELENKYVEIMCSQRSFDKGPGVQADGTLSPYAINHEIMESCTKEVFVGEKRKYLKGREINEIMNRISNPVTKRSISQTIKVLNAIIQKYGSPQFIAIQFTEEMIRNYVRANLQDTRYISSIFINNLAKYLEFAPCNGIDKKKRVYTVNGAITAYLEKCWDLIQNENEEHNKSNSFVDTYYAGKAVIVACCTEEIIRKLSGNVMELEEAQKYDEVSLPWSHLKTELAIRMKEDPVRFLMEHPNKAELLDYPPEWFNLYDPIIRPIFVSRMPNHKVTGPAHEETIRSPRHFEKEGYVVYRTDIKNLKLDKNGEIANYYNPESDRLLYEALKKQLLENNNNGVKAFAGEFYKPKADGTIGPIVKKVKMIKKQSLGVYTNQGQGIADNGPMVRVDVFKENEKYYFVPIYTADTKKKELPDRAAVANKKYAEWKIVKDEDFIFSLYSRDLIYIRHKSTIKLRNSAGQMMEVPELLAYFINANIATASFHECITHDNKYYVREMGIQSLLELKKYQVDVLGNYYEVKKEKRMKFHHQK